MPASLVRAWRETYDLPTLVTTAPTITGPITSLRSCPDNITRLKQKRPLVSMIIAQAISRCRDAFMVLNRFRFAAVTRLAGPTIILWTWSYPELPAPRNRARYVKNELSI